MKWRVPYNIGRFQICPRVAKELEAGRAVTVALVAQAMKRCLTYLFTSDCIWRHAFRNQAPERLDVSAACGIVYGCHRVRPREQLPEEGRIGSPGELKGTLGCEARAGQTTREQLLRASQESGR